MEREREREGRGDLVEEKVNHLLVILALQLVALLLLSRRQFDRRCRTTSQQ